MKFGKRITIEEFEKLLAQDYGFLMQSQDDILQEFYHRLTSECLKPNVQVSYKREPYVYAAGNVRITFDSMIKSSLANHNWNYDSPLISATDSPEQIVMETNVVSVSIPDMLLAFLFSFILGLFLFYLL